MCLEKGSRGEAGDCANNEGVQVITVIRSCRDVLFVLACSTVISLLSSLTSGGNESHCLCFLEANFKLLLFIYMIVNLFIFTFIF